MCGGVYSNFKNKLDWGLRQMEKHIQKYSCLLYIWMYKKYKNTSWNSTIGHVTFEVVHNMTSIENLIIFI